MASARQVERGSQAFGNDPLHQVAFGKNSNKFAVVENRNGSDVSFHHGAHRFQYGLAQLCLIDFLVLDQIANTHWILPGRSLLKHPKSHIGGRVYAQIRCMGRAKQLGKKEKIGSSHHSGKSDGDLEDANLSCHHADAIRLFERSAVCPKKNETRGIMPLRGQTLGRPGSQHDVVFPAVARAYISKNIRATRLPFARAGVWLDDG